jgi:trichothecene efflux pump TRI12
MSRSRSVALWLTWRARPADTRRPVPVDWRGAILVSAGMGLAVLGLQQSANWGWDSAATWACISVGAALLAVFVRFELGHPNPLIEVGIFADRGFAADNVVMGLVYACFLPLFFFASVYAQVVLGYNAGKTGLYILVIFIGFAVATQLGGRMLDRRGAKPAGRSSPRSTPAPAPRRRTSGARPPSSPRSRATSPRRRGSSTRDGSGVMAASFVVALRRMERGIPGAVTDAVEAEAAVESPR